MVQSPVTFADLLDGFQQLGIRRGMIVEVHSSLRSFGWVEGGAETVIAALMDAVGSNGTLVMSAYPVSPAIPLTDEDRARGIAWKVRKLSLNGSERTGMGIIADTFRQRADVISGAGFFRTCAWGQDAEWHGEGYRGLLALDGWCLLLGVGIDRCSSMHAAEDAPLPADIAAYMDIPEQVRRGYDPQQWNIGGGETPEDAWRKVWEAADRQGLILHRQIGQAACHAFKARSVVGIYKHWRQTDPYGLYGVKRPGD
ncbi:MAG TPA: AAC(3) family N-acetyltransferase [Anaerolineaceae bacterium]|nr:AAC(3) family N-acetyltransferase [Anaerolineaceae bacterium]